MADGQVAFELDEEDVVGAARHFAARRLPIRPGILVTCALVAGMIGLLLARGSDNHLLNVLSLMVLVLALVMAALVFFVVPRQARNHFRELASARGDMTFAWDDRGTLLTGAKGVTNLAWSDYSGWSETDGLLILLQSRMLYNLVPKRALTEGQLTEIRACLASAGVRQRYR